MGLSKISRLGKSQKKGSLHSSFTRLWDFRKLPCDLRFQAIVVNQCRPITVLTAL